jgi:capsular polysaccharide biosynthesis protein
MKKQQENLLMTLLIGIIVGVTIVVLTGCVAKHPKCAAYDKVEIVK